MWTRVVQLCLKYSFYDEQIWLMTFMWPSRTDLKWRRKKKGARWIFKSLNSHYTVALYVNVKCCGDYLFAAGSSRCLEWTDPPSWPVTAEGGGRLWSSWNGPTALWLGRHRIKSLIGKVCEPIETCLSNGLWDISEFITVSLSFGHRCIQKTKTLDADTLQALLSK